MYIRACVGVYLYICVCVCVCVYIINKIINLKLTFCITVSPVSGISFDLEFGIISVIGAVDVVDVVCAVDVVVDVARKIILSLFAVKENYLQCNSFLIQKINNITMCAYVYVDVCMRTYECV